MGAPQLNNFTKDLAACSGFKLTPERKGEQYRIARPTRDAILDPSFCCFSVFGTEIVVDKVELYFGHDKLKQNLIEAAKKILGPKTITSIKFASDNTIWFTFEFTRPGSREAQRGYRTSSQAPKGSAGFKCRLFTKDECFGFTTSDHFAIGYVPETFVNCANLLIEDALNLPKAEFVSLFEFQYPIASIFFKATKKALQKYTFNCPNLFVDHLQKGLSISNNQNLHSTGSISLEALESREFIGEYSELDRLLFYGKLSKARKVIEDQLQIQPTNQYLIRRSYLLEVSNKTIAGRMTDLSIGKNLYYSKIIQDQNISASSRLKAASSLVSKLHNEIPNFENNPATDLVFSEQLGDLWSHLDYTKAEFCYLRALQKRKNNPRVLRKIIKLYRNSAQPNKQLTFLKILAENEKRRQEKAKIYFQLALLCQGDIHQSICYARKALSQDKQNLEFATYLAQYLINTGAYEEGISILENTIRLADVKCNNRTLAEAEELLSQIWRTLGHNELAEKKHQQALQADPSHASNYASLAQLNDQKISSIPKIDAIEQHSPQPITADEPKLDLFAYSDEETALSFANQVNSGIETNESSDTTLKNEGDVQLEKAEKCFESEHDGLQAIQHLNRAMTYGKINTACFHMAREFIAKEQGNEQLATFMQQAIPLLPQQIKRQVISEFINIPGLNDSMRSQAALDLYNSFNDMSELQKIFVGFTHDESLEAFENLRDIVFQNLHTDAAKNQWLSFLIESINDRSGEDKFEILAKLCNEKISISDDPTAEKESAIEILKFSSDKSHIKRHVKSLLDQQVIPPLSEKAVYQVLDNSPEYIFKFFYLNFKNEINENQASIYARSALSIDQNPNIAQHETLELLSFLLHANNITNGELSLLIDVAKENASWGLYQDAMNQKINSSTPEYAAKLSYDSAVVLLENASLTGQALAFYFEGIKFGNNFSKEFEQKAFNLIRQKNDRHLAKQMFLSILETDPNIWLSKRQFADQLLHFPELTDDNAIKSKLIEHFQALEPGSITTQKMIDILSRNLVDPQILADKVDFFATSMTPGELSEFALAFITKFEPGPLSTTFLKNIFSYRVETRKKAVEEALTLLRKKLQNLSSKSAFAYLEVLNEIFESERAHPGTVDKNTKPELIYAPSKDVDSLEINLIMDSGLQDNVDQLRPEERQTSALKTELEISLDLNHEYAEIDLGTVAKNKQTNQDLSPEPEPDVELTLRIDDSPKASQINIEESNSLKFEKTIPSISPDADGGSSSHKEINTQNKHESFAKKNFEFGSIGQVTSVDLAAAISTAGAGEFNKEEFSQAFDVLNLPKVNLGTTNDAISSVDLDSSQPIPELIAASPEHNSQPKKNDKQELDDPPSKSQEVIDWRTMIRDKKTTDRSVAQIISHAFASELEKHIAIQAVAVVSSNFQDLEQWHWPVWRNKSGMSYQFKGKERFPNEYNRLIFDSPLHQLVVALAPAFAKIYSHRFTKDGLSKKLNLQPMALEKLLTPLSWDTGILQNIGFTRYKDKVKGHKYTPWTLSGLGASLFYDIPTRSVIIDTAYYKNRPQSHLFFRLLRLLWAKKIGYLVPLSLHPTKEAYPLMTEIGNTFRATGIKKLANVFGGNKTLANALRSLDHEKVAILFSKSKGVNMDHVQELWFAMEEHIQRLMLSETLDLIGVLESWLDLNLTDTPDIKFEQIQQSFPQISEILNFATHLKLD